MVQRDNHQWQHAHLTVDLADALTDAADSHTLIKPFSMAVGFQFNAPCATLRHIRGRAAAHDQTNGGPGQCQYTPGVPSDVQTPGWGTRIQGVKAQAASRVDRTIHIIGVDTFGSDGQGIAPLRQPVSRILPVGLGRQRNRGVGQSCPNECTGIAVGIVLPRPTTSATSYDL